MFPPRKPGMGVNTAPSGVMSKMAGNVPGKGPFSAMPSPAVPLQNTQSGNMQGFQGINTGPSGGFGVMNPISHGPMNSMPYGPVNSMPQDGVSEAENFWQKYLAAMQGARTNPGMRGIF